MDPDRAARMLATIDGCEFDPTDPVLLIRTRRSRLTFDRLLTNAGSPLKQRFGDAIVHRLSDEVPECVHRDFQAVRGLVNAAAAVRGVPVSELSLDDVRARLSSLCGSKPEACNGLLYGLRRMAPLLGAAMETSLRCELVSMRPMKRKRKPGNARSPGDRCGALSNAEFAALASRLATRLAAGEITPEDHVLAVLEATLYPRPAQIAMLKARDLVQVGFIGGVPQYKLRIARIKQRGRLYASSSRLRSLDPGLARLLVAQVERAVRTAASYGIGAEEAPAFPRDIVTTVLGTEFPELPGYALHPTSGDIQRRVINALGVASRCARRTIGTRMRADNRSYRQIGLVLDNEAASARIYVDDTPEMIARVERKLGAALAPLANLFMGRPGGCVPSLFPKEPEL